ncbi:MAG: type II secretion system protein GspM [Thiofilum sp.]|uniref:type II secretion system protein GspM n=1 Tax=Thiofilum sp. TaxID=2212733 RepID=UPI0025CE038F|nr:type II secretion system protein GspM [Thiofilum sp.]MBK8452216.1 type II secretion system protein M [Thiofilum sp.]
MKTWWYTLAPRERLWVIVGSLLILATVLWFYAITPLLSYKHALHESHTEALANQLQLKQLAPIVAAQTRPALEEPVTNEKLAYLVEPLLQRYELDRPEILVSQSEVANGAVNLRLQKAPFNQIAALLGALELHHQAYAVQFNITPTPEAGLVNANITLQR